jgi:hypothetical protein
MTGTFMQLNSLDCSEGFTAIGITEDGKSAWSRSRLVLGSVPDVRTAQNT